MAQLRVAPPLGPQHPAPVRVVVKRAVSHVEIPVLQRVAHVQEALLPPDQRVVLHVDAVHVKELAAQLQRDRDGVGFEQGVVEYGCVV